MTTKIRRSPTPEASLILLLTLLVAASGAFALPPDTAGTNSIDFYLRDLPFPKPEITEPRFPQNRFPITDFGAVADGHTLNTEAITRAIRACSEKGGGSVIVPPGTWITGPVKLESNVNLHLETGALLQYSSRIDDYSLVAGFDGKSKKYIVTPLVWGYRLKNIAVTGDGVLDGAGEIWRPVKKEKQTAAQWKALLASGGAVSADGKIWWPSKDAADAAEFIAAAEKSGQQLSPEDYTRAKPFLRPNMLQFVQCQGILLDGPTFRNSPRFHVYPQQSENIIVRHVKINTEWWAQNGDGIDLGACRNVLVCGCTVDAGDDGICIKAGSLAKSQQPGFACENIVIADCIVYHAHGGFVVGSDTKGSARNISVRNCTFLGTDVGLRFKSARGHGGVIKDIFIDNIRMGAVRTEAILFDLWYADQSPDEATLGELVNRPAEPVTGGTPQFRDIRIRNVTCTAAQRAVLMNGLPEMPVQGISLQNVSISSNEGALMIDADSISMDHVSLAPATGPVVSLVQSRNVSFQKFGFPPGLPRLLKVEGSRSTGIIFMDTDTPGLKTGIELGKDVKSDAVVIKIGGKL